MTSPVILNHFNYAQTFYIDPGSVQNADEIGITAIDVYFRARPKEVNNSSGIVSPGVTLFLCDTRQDGMPKLSPLTQFAISRKEYNEIIPSNDASSVTQFTFTSPINVKTGKKYAIIIKFDGNESFDLWTSIEGKPLVEDETINAGPAGQYIGEFYEYGDLNTSTINTSGNTASNSTYPYLGQFKPINDTDLKFTVYCAKYSFDAYSNSSSNTASGLNVTNMVATRSYILPKRDYEFIVFDRLNSTNLDDLKGGEYIWQNNIIQPYSIVVSNGSTLVTSTDANFTSIYDQDTENDQFILLKSGTSKNIRKIIDIQSNSTIIIDQPATFSNVAAKFSKVAAGELDVGNESKAFKVIEDILLIDNSNANSSLRFVNNTIENITINDGGVGYTNGDIIFVNSGAANNSAPPSIASANITTDANGTIINYTFLNKGYGYTEIPSSIINDSTTNSSSSGSGANLSFTVGSTLHTELSNATLSNCHVINLPINTTEVNSFDTENPSGTSFYMRHHYLYYSTGDGVQDVAIYSGGSGYTNNDTITITGGSGSGAHGYIKTDSNGKIVNVLMSNNGSGYTSAPSVSVSGGSSANLIPVLGVNRNTSSQYPESFSKNIMLFGRYNLEYANTPIILSRSNEVTQSNVQITLESGVSVNTNISSLVEMVITSNNVFSSADILSGEIDVLYSKYAINNDYTNEHLGTGRAIAKHISTKMSFSDDNSAEDIRVYFDAYRPKGTDIKVYAKIHCNEDPEPFDDKDWTLLEYKNNTQHIYSSTGIFSDEVEYECGFSQYPNSEFIASGTVTTENGNTTILGAGTEFDNEISANDLIKIYSPLFPNNYMISVVDTVISNTELSIRDSVSNNNVIGSGFNLDVLEFKNQAFNNFLNDNVVRYYDGSMRQYDRYDKVAVKTVFLSENDNLIPRVNNIRIIGVSS